MGGLVVPLPGQVGPARASAGRRRPVLARQCRLPRLQEPQRPLGLFAWRLRRASLSIKYQLTAARKETRCEKFEKDIASSRVYY